MSVDKSLIHLSLVPSISPRTIQQLLQEFESADKILSLTLDDIDSGKLSADPNLLRRIVYEKGKISVDQELELIQENDCQVVTYSDSSYPVLLKDISDPPPVLYFKGEIPPETTPYLSIVGTREPTDSTKEICYKLASQSANKGMTIVSGATNGVDETAHRHRRPRKNFSHNGLWIKPSSFVRKPKFNCRDYGKWCRYFGISYVCKTQSNEFCSAKPIG